MIPKFRAWDRNNNNMILPDKLAYVNFAEELVGEIFSENTMVGYGFSDVILMQSTGLKDTNGVEIFDGDLIQLFNGDVGKVSYNKILAFWEVQFNNGELNLNDIIYFGGEVIGNIYEDKHLLEE